MKYFCYVTGCSDSFVTYKEKVQDSGSEHLYIFSFYEYSPPKILCYYIKNWSTKQISCKILIYFAICMKYFCYVTGCNGSLVTYKKHLLRTTRLIFFEKPNQNVTRKKNRIQYSGSKH